MNIPTAILTLMAATGYGSVEPSTSPGPELAAVDDDAQPADVQQARPRPKPKPKPRPRPRPAPCLECGQG